VSLYKSNSKLLQFLVRISTVLFVRDHRCLRQPVILEKFRNCFKHRWKSVVYQTLLMLSQRCLGQNWFSSFPNVFANTKNFRLEIRAAVEAKPIHEKPETKISCYWSIQDIKIFTYILTKKRDWRLLCPPWYKNHQFSAENRKICTYTRHCWIRVYAQEF
jgi:hypothetical protein